MVEICSSHYKEDLDWLKNYEHRVHIVHKEGGSPIDNATYTMPNVGCEAGSYLKFILERYDTLPDHVAFIHGHEDAYHQNGGVPLLDLIRTANIEKYGFIDLNNAWRCMISSSQFNMYDKELKELGIRVPPLFITCSGAQFIVSKECIQRNSKDYYEKLFTYMYEKSSAIMLEYLWQYIFTGNFNCVPRRDSFSPPLKENLFACCSSTPLTVDDIHICYCGKLVFPGMHHIPSKEMYDKFRFKGAIFIIFRGDELACADCNVDEKVMTLPCEQYIQFLHSYTNTVQQFENLYRKELET
jgi:hypothetical protein